MFASPESIQNHLSQSGLYADIANLVKFRVDQRLEERLQDRIVLRALSERLLDAVVTPEFIQEYSKPLFTVGQKIIEKDLELANNKVVVDTAKYKDRIENELAQRQIPELIVPYVENIVAAVPDKLQLVDLNERPNSILGYLTKAEVWYGRITATNTIAWFLAIASAILLIIINSDALRRLCKLLFPAYIIPGIIVFVGSFLFPYIVVLNTDVQTNIYLNKLISNAVYYFFELTRNPSYILLVLGGIFFLLSRWSYMDNLQDKLDSLLNRSQPARKKKSKSTK